MDILNFTINASARNNPAIKVLWRDGPGPINYSSEAANYFQILIWMHLTTWLHIHQTSYGIFT